MKIILVDGNEANVEKTVGVSIYTQKLLFEFKKYASTDLRFCVYLRQKPMLHLPRENQYYRYRVVFGPVLWLRFFLPISLYMDYVKQEIRKRFRLSYVEFKAYFAPAHYSPKYLPNGCKLFVTIHDLAFLLYPEEFLAKDRYKLIHWSENSIYRADKIIAVSRNTKNDIIKMYHIPEDQISVVYNGFTPQITTDRDNSLSNIGGKDYKLENSKYFLYIGTLQPRKNIANLLYAFALFAKEKTGYKMVIVGKKGWMYENILSLASKLKIDHIVHFTGYVSDKDKATLLKYAICLAVPSFYEGFGIPVLEAFSASCPVICSNASSLPEIAGDSALYFDPNSPSTITNCMRQIDSDLQLRNNLITSGEKQKLKFSWEKCASETLDVILS
jgi:glycosyltransferase involved in cell wall biosynthesis